MDKTPPFLMQISGRTTSVKDVVFQMLHFLDNDDLAMVHEAHYITHPLLQSIPRTPFCYTNRYSLIFSFDLHNPFYKGYIVKVRESVNEDLAGCHPIDLYPNGNFDLCIPRDIPYFWYLIRSSIFNTVQFSKGNISQNDALIWIDEIQDIFVDVVQAISKKIEERKIRCYRIFYYDIFTKDFKHWMDKYFEKVPIPLSEV